MKPETSTHPERGPDEPSEGQRVQVESIEDVTKHRSDPRYELVAHAYVTVPSLPTRVYTLQEISRGGMFLAFGDRSTTRLELEQNGIERGTAVEIKFAISAGEEKHSFDVRANIARITRQGLALEFLTHNPPQLAALRELFERAGANTAAADDTGTPDR